MFVRKRQATLKQVWSCSGRIPQAWAYSNLESRGRFSEYCNPERPSSLNINYAGLSVFHENLNLSNMWYDYDSFYFGKGIKISTQSSNLMRILWKHLSPGLQIRYRDTAFKSSLIFPLCFNPLHLSNVLICSTLYFPKLFSNFVTGALKRRAELIANSAFPYSVLATSTSNGQCLSESWWGVTFLWRHLYAALFAINLWCNRTT